MFNLNIYALSVLSFSNIYIAIVIITLNKV